MSNGTIITPLTPDENIEAYKETPKDIYSPSDFPDNQTKERHKSDINNCCKKWIFLDFIPITTLIYGFSPLLLFYCFYEMIQKQKYSYNAPILIN